MSVFKLVFCAVFGYAMGNISSGILVGKAFGIKDIRKVGSGNAGTTNVLRNLGWFPSILTLVGDCLKGLIPSLIGWNMAGTAGLLTGGIAAIIGHDFPAAFGFKGGKGIATSLGVLLVLDCRLALVLFVVQIVAVAITRYMSFGSLINTLAFPFIVGFLYRGRSDSRILVIGAIIMSVLSLYGHRENLIRLFRGEENKLDFKSIAEKSKSLKKKKSQFDKDHIGNEDKVERNK